MNIHWMGVAFALVISTSYAQDIYQKAKTPLDAKVILDTPIKQAPNPSAANLLILPKDTMLIVLGKQGDWFDIFLKGRRGWVSSPTLQLMGPVSTTTSVPVQEPTRSVATQSKASRFSSDGEPKWFVSATLAAGIKSIDQSFRAGVGYGLFSFQRSSFNLLFGAAMQSDKFLYFGPGFSNDLGFSFLGARMNFLTSTPFYYLSDSTTKKSNFAIGTQIGPQLSYGHGMKVTVSLAMETILFGATRTRISILPTLGCVF